MAEKPRIHESWEPLIETHVRETQEVAAREPLREAVQSHIERAGQASANAPPPSQSVSHPVPHPKEGQLKAMEESQQLSALAHIALEEGIEPAIALAKRLGSPYVIDALHDFITDRLLHVVQERKSSKRR